MSDLITPTGVLVTDAPPESAAWFAARREGITGTDLPKILGYSRYGNALSVFLFKRDELDDTAGEAARWGQLLEDVIAQEWSEVNDCYVEPVGVIAHQAYPWRRASLDRLVTWCPDGPRDRPEDDQFGTPPVTCGLEVKTRSAFKASDWSDGVPDDTLAQTTWGLHVTGLDHMHVAALIGGQRLLTFRVDRDEKLIDYLVAAAEPVWEAVVNGVPPEAHPDSEGVLLDLLNKVYAKREGERPVDRSEAEAWVDQYLDGADLAAKAEEMQTEAKTALVQLLGDGDTAVVDEQAWWTYKRPKGSDKVYTGDLKRLSVERPLLYSILRSRGYISSPIPGPRFALKRTRIEEASPAVSGDLPGLVER